MREVIRNRSRSIPLVIDGKPNEVFSYTLLYTFALTGLMVYLARFLCPSAKSHFLSVGSFPATWPPFNVRVMFILALYIYLFFLFFVNFETKLSGG